jgi:arylsulfatase A-like enzyme
MYDANMRWGDWGVGAVVHALRHRNLLDNTLLIVTADHGEAFGEHGYLFHCLSVYDEAVHIPLLIRFPGPQRLVGQVEALTQTVDLLPTVLDLAGGSFPKQRVQGVSLRPVLEGREGTGREYVFSRSGGRWPQYLVRDSRWALIRYSGAKLKALYDLRKDPAEEHNVAVSHPEVVAKLTAALQAFGRTQTRSPAEFTTPGASPPIMPKAPARPLSDRARRELKALGYLD